MKRRCALKMCDYVPLSCLLLLLLLLGWSVDAACPFVCDCSDSQRAVDCSWRSPRHLPVGLELNIHTLNLSHNLLYDLDHHLAPYTHLRTLDLSQNRLKRLPTSLPRSLWEIRASGNQIQVLEKNDTAYQWNLRELDLSDNRLHRVVFINNTLPSLRALNLSYNKFWTVPTNMPPRLEVLDLSHNLLVQVLPGSLDRLASLARFYLHNNLFSGLSEGAFEGLVGLRIITLGGNRWKCEEPVSVGYLQAWVNRTPARVLGCPCPIWSTCGEAHLARTSGWHFASYTLSPHRPPESALTNVLNPRETPGTTGKLEDDGPPTPDVSTPKGVASTLSSLLPTDRILKSSTRRTATLRTRSVKRVNQGLGRNGGHGSCATFTISLSVLLIITSHLLNY